MPVKIGPMRNAGPYYGIPLDKLPAMEWSPEEQRTIERICEKIHKNIAEEEMTPMQRFNATYGPKAPGHRDRLLMEVAFHVTYAVRQLDGFSDTIRPLDAYQLPKMCLIAHLMTVARYKLDIVFLGPTNYAENMFGAPAAMIADGNPVQDGPMYVKSMKELEDLECPDPTKDGLYPQYLWWLRETRKIWDKYGLTDKMPLEGSFCAGPDNPATMFGYTEYIVALKKNPDLAKKGVYLMTEWMKRLGKAVYLDGKVDYAYMCAVVGMFPLKNAEWVAAEYGKVGKFVKAAVKKPMIHAWAFEPCVQWVPQMIKDGAVGEDSFNGIMFTGDVPSYKIGFDLLEKIDANRLANPPADILVSGPMSDVEEEIKKRCNDAKSQGQKSKASIGIGAVDYFTTPEHLDFSVAAAKKHGKF